MNATPPNIVPILATPFGVVPLPDAEAENSELVQLFAERMRRNGAARQSDPLCYRSPDGLLEWPEEPVRRLAAAIFRGVHSVVRAVNDFSQAQLNSLTLQRSEER